MATKLDFKHPLYTEHEDQLLRVNNVYDGIDSAKQYLQQYAQEEENDYADRQDIATLDNFVFRTVEDIKNIIFRKSLDKSGINNEEIKKYSDRINFSDSLNEFSKTVLKSRIREGYTFVLVDSAAYDTEKVVNKAQQEALGIRPYFVNILRSNVLSWKTNVVGEYTQIVIREDYDVPTEFTIETKEQIKVWSLEDGYVSVDVYRDDLKYGNTLETNLIAIPIVKIGSDIIPPLYDMAKINITHMNRDSEVSNYSRIGGAAFLAVFGNLDDADSPKTLGINKGLKFRDKQDSDVKWIEMGGQNYEMLKDRILYHEDQMNRIAVSFSLDQATKTATQVNKESMTGESKVTDYASELEEGINLSIKLLDLYKTEGSYGENEIKVNKDFDSAILTPEMVASYRLDYTSGIISYETLIEILVAGEYFKEMTEEEMETEKTRLLTGPAAV